MRTNRTPSSWSACRDWPCDENAAPGGRADRRAFAGSGLRGRSAPGKPRRHEAFRRPRRGRACARGRNPGQGHDVASVGAARDRAARYVPKWEGNAMRLEAGQGRARCAAIWRRQTSAWRRSKGRKRRARRTSVISAKLAASATARRWTPKFSIHGAVFYVSHHSSHSFALVSKIFESRQVPSQ